MKKILKLLNKFEVWDFNFQNKKYKQFILKIKKISKKQ